MQISHSKNLPLRSANRSHASHKSQATTGSHSSHTNSLSHTHHAAPGERMQTASGSWETFLRREVRSDQSAEQSRRPEKQVGGMHAQTNRFHRREPCESTRDRGYGEKPGYLPLSRTTDRVLGLLLEGDLSRVRAESVAENLGISCTTLRRRLRNDHTSYQFLLDRARQYRCESRLRKRWLPGKCLADELGYLEVNSFYRAFRRWTGLSYSDYRQRYH